MNDCNQAPGVGGRAAMSRLEAMDSLRELRDEFARNAKERTPAQWLRLAVEVRIVLVMFAGVDAAGEFDLRVVAMRDWREFSPREQAAIKQTGALLRWQLNGARELFN